MTDFKPTSSATEVIAGHPAWVIETDEETGWGPSHPVVLDESGSELFPVLSHHPDEGVRIHVDVNDSITLHDARRIAEALLDLADIADPGKLATQKLRDLIDASRSGLADADELDEALTAVEFAYGVPVTTEAGK